ncbi:hypothetical protein BpHYR1_001408 [Brachionus plicatilis]|uniref:Uncharacterized protein n=1 Tax=Brachionus plicatilis TaxID=10195 RepID=A0A3M7RW65_BRAPC|nr:hypothetical protein BpHYR1_001408 [Brachionus plicatilis]
MKVSWGPEQKISLKNDIEESENFQNLGAFIRLKRWVVLEIAPNWWIEIDKSKGSYNCKYLLKTTFLNLLLRYLALQIQKSLNWNCHKKVRVRDYI